MNRFLSRTTATQVLQKIIQDGWSYAYDHEKHRLVILDEQGDDLFFFRLPLTFPPPQPETQPEQPVHYIILLVQSGNAALGYFEDGKNLDHKVYRSYMVRKKQGTSQVKYLKTKGKSRAGSRVRLGETVEFFDNINRGLQAYFSDHRIDRIAISCSKILQPLLYDANVATPFDKQDSRLFKIPMHVHTPIYEVMLEVNKFLMKAELIYEPIHQPLIDLLLPPSFSKNEAPETAWLLLGFLLTLIKTCSKTIPLTKPDF